MLIERTASSDMSTVVDAATDPSVSSLRVLDRSAVAAIATAISALAVLVFYWLFIESTTFTFAGRKFYTLFDDAMISMRYARNLADGYGLVWNAGDAPVEGYTNFLWTLWMTLLHLVGLSEATVSAFVSLSGAVTIVGTALTMRAIARRLYPQDDCTAQVALWGTLVYYPLVFWSLRGMEVGLIALLLGMSVLLALRLQDEFRARDVVALGAVSCLGILTRMEFAVTAVVIAAFVVFVCREQRMVSAATLTLFVAATIAAFTAFRYSYYGDLLPNTYYLKLEGMGLVTRLSRGIISLLYAVFTHLAGLLVLVSLYLARKKKRVGSRELLLFAVSISAIAYSVWVGGDAWEEFCFANRYIAPVVPLLLIFAARGAQTLPDHRRSVLLAGVYALLIVAVVNLLIPNSGRGTSIGLRALAIVIMAVLLLTPLLFRAGAIVMSRKPIARTIPMLLFLFSLNVAPLGAWVRQGAPHADGDAAWSTYGLTLRETTNQDASVAVTWAGAVSYFSQRKTLDELGKTDAIIAHGPNVAVSFRPGHSKWNLAHTIGELQPDLISALFFVSDQDLANIRAWGYEPLIGSCFYRRNTRLLDVDALRSALLRLQADARFKVFVCGPFLTVPSEPPKVASRN